MNSVRKLITYLSLAVFVFSQYANPVLAIDALHSIDELPSMQEEGGLTELLIEKALYENHMPLETVITEDVSVSTLVEERKMYIASEVSSESASSLYHGFITDPFRATTVMEERDLFAGFLVTGLPRTTEHEEGRPRQHQKVGKVKSTKGEIRADIAPGTIIRTASGDIMDESIISIGEIDAGKMRKARTQFEKKLKNRGNARKGRITASPEGFEFGLSGTHLIFSSPVRLSIDMPNASDGIVVDLLTMHAGDRDFHTNGLSVDANTLCNDDGSATKPGSQVTVKGGKITFYTCGASLFTMNPSGGSAGSNDLRILIGDCAQVQIYYNNLSQVYGGNPPATGCTGVPSAWPVLRIGGTNYGNTYTAWTTATTVGNTSGNTYTATSTMTAVTGGRTYTLIIDWAHTAPNKYVTWSWRVIVPTGNTLPIKLYYGMDSYVAGADANDVGYYTSTGGQTIGIYDNVANVLSAFRYISGSLWTAHQANGYNTVRTQITNGANFTNAIQTTGGDLGFGANWDFGTPGATTFSGTIEWRLLPYVSTNVVDLIPGIAQPEGPLTTGYISQLPITLTNAGNLTSSGIHTAILTLPANISGPSSPFVDNGWSCGATVGTTVTCTKTTTIASLAGDTFRIPVIPLPAAGGSNVTFNVSISNPGDSNTTNNTAFATNSVVSATIAYSPGGVTGANLWLKADGNKNCNTNGCTITTWNNSGAIAINAITGLGTVTYSTGVTMNYNPTIYFNNASLNVANNLGVTAASVSIFTTSRIGAGGSFRIGPQTAVNNSLDWSTTPTTDRLARYNGTIFFNGANLRAAGTADISTTTRAAGGAAAAYTDGRVTLNAAGPAPGFVGTNIGIGRTVNTNATLAHVGEVIIYPTELTVVNRNKVESYLAIKYGITLDQTTAQNYTLSNNALAWNSAGVGLYRNDIAGIARDDVSSLNQSRSQSVNNTGDIIVNSVTAIGTNYRSLLWANDGTATGAWVATDAPTGYQRITREWQFQEKNGNIGNVKVNYPVASVPAGFTGTLMMLVDGDGTFATGATAYTGTLNAGNWEFTVDVADMTYMTFARTIVTDTTPPVISGSSIASGTLIPLGNFTLSYNYSDTGSAIAPATATGQIYSWNSGTLSYNVIPLAGYMTLGSSNTSSATMNIANLPYGRYRFDLSIADTVGNISTRSFTYFVDAIEWTISADTYNIGNITQNIATFGTGELIVTVRTVGAGFGLTSAPSNPLTMPSGDTVNYWDGTFGVGYDLWNGSAFLGNIITYSPNTTLATVAKNINQNGAKNTFTYRIKYGAQINFMQVAGDYTGTVQFGLSLDY